MTEENPKFLIDLVQSMNQVSDTIDTVCKLAGTYVKQDILQAFVQGDIDTVRALAADFDDFDEDFFNSLLNANDSPRIFLYLNSLGNDRSVEIDYVTTILKGVNSALVYLCNMFWAKYENKQIEFEDYQIDTLRYVCAMHQGVDLDVP